VASRALAGILRYLRLTVATKSDDRGDGQLLRRFVADRDEEAFAGLLRRHGPLVFGVCRQVLGDVHDAEDAFQATFLVLARKAATVSRQDSVAAWLHRVALNVSRTARTGAARRRAHERQAALMTRPSPADEVALRDWQPLLHEEVDRLPEKYRLPVVLCHLEGRTHEEAARQLGWPLGSVKGRLARARDLLRARLTRRGLALGTAGVAAALAARADAAVPPALVTSTLRAAVSFAGCGAVPTATASARAVALAKGALQTMTGTKLIVALLVALAAGAVTVAALGPTLGRSPKPDGPPGGPVAKDKKEDGVNESKPVVVEGLSFVAFAPARVAVPRDGETDVPLGLRVTNTTDKPVTLATFDVIQPRLYFVSGKRVVEVGMDSRRKDGPKAPPPVMLGKGESWTWEPKARLDWTYVRSTLQLHGPDGLGVAGAWSFGTLHAGTHRLVIEYNNAAARQDDVAVWVGKATPEEVEFEIVEPGKAEGRALPAGPLKGHPEKVESVTVSPDGKTLVSGGKDLRVWDVATGKERYRLDVEPIRSRPVAFSPDGKALAVLDKGNVLRLLDADTAKERWQSGVSTDRSITDVTFSPDGRWLAGTDIGNKYRVKLWDAATGKLFRQLSDGGACVAFAADSKTLTCAATRDGRVVTWAVDTGKEVAKFQDKEYDADQRSDLYIPAFSTLSPDGKTAALGSGKTVRVWDVPTGKEVSKFDWAKDDGDPPEGPCGAALSPDGKLLAVNGLQPEVRLVDLAAGKVVRRLKGHEGAVLCVAFSPDGRFLVSGSADKTVRVWDLAVPDQP
jgi:RNA polymerase sigma factor (sigma-70 family)